MPNVSIIMGVYNCKNYNLLRKSVESILQQTYKDYEFIICNDGSTNNTLEELKKIAQSDSRIKIISYEKNRGLNHALNECLAVSQGKYIARQDDDDVSKPERLKKQVQFLDENREYAIVGTCADVFDNNGIWGEYTVPEKPQKGDFLWNSPFMNMLYFWKEIARFIPALIVPCLIGIAIMKFVNITGFVKLGLFAMAYTVVYAFSMYFFGMNDEEKQLVIGPIRKILRK